ncbi:MAG: hypothetical protein KUG56_01030 [Kordiimonadaceae bacterium]|nr:hypothetical protein [Kordiimonadaceae bacterium]
MKKILITAAVLMLSPTSYVFADHHGDGHSAYDKMTIEQLKKVDKSTLSKEDKKAYKAAWHKAKGKAAKMHGHKDGHGKGMKNK